MGKINKELKHLLLFFLVPSVVHRSYNAIIGGFSNEFIAVSNKGKYGIGDNLVMFVIKFHKLKNHQYKVENKCIYCLGITI